MKVLYISNIPTPYRNEFFNELGKHVDLTVIFEAKSGLNVGLRFNWSENDVKTYKAIFLSVDAFLEHKINTKIFKYLKESYDYIFVTNYYCLTEMAAIIYLKLKHTPYLMEIDGGLVREESTIKRSYKKFLISGAKKYFSPSDEADKFLFHYGVKKTNIIRTPFSSVKENQIITSPIDKKEKEEIRKTLQIVEKNVIVGVGQLIERKGWDLILNIAKEIDAGIYILGDGVLLPEYKKIIENNHLVNVHLIGFKNSDDVAMYMKSADIFVLPTREDVWGLVINEAMAYGLPVITTDRCVAGLELVENGVNGFVVPVDDSTLLLKAIKQAITDKEFMSKGSLKKIKGYTIENMVKAHISFFESQILQTK